MSDFVIQMRAVVIGFDGVTGRVMIVGMEGIEVSAYALYRFKVLFAVRTIMRTLSPLEHT